MSGSGAAAVVARPAAGVLAPRSVPASVVRARAAASVAMGPSAPSTNTDAGFKPTRLPSVIARDVVDAWLDKTKKMPEEWKGVFDRLKAWTPLQCSLRPAPRMGGAAVLSDQTRYAVWVFVFGCQLLRECSSREVMVKQASFLTLWAERVCAGSNTRKRDGMLLPTLRGDVMGVAEEFALHKSNVLRLCAAKSAALALAVLPHVLGSSSELVTKPGLETVLWLDVVNQLMDGTLARAQSAKTEEELNKCNLQAALISECLHSAQTGLQQLVFALCPFSASATPTIWPSETGLCVFDNIQRADGVTDESAELFERCVGRVALLHAKADLLLNNVRANIADMQASNSRLLYAGGVDMDGDTAAAPAAVLTPPRKQKPQAPAAPTAPAVLSMSPTLPSPPRASLTPPMPRKRMRDEDTIAADIATAAAVS